jgi:hypothetical protein
MTQSKHTPEPWFLQNGNEIHDKDTRFDESGARIGETPNLIAMVDFFNTDANARHIVRCVNSHPALLQALRAVVAMEYDRDPESRNFDEERLEYFSLLIAQAEGRSA